MTWSNLKQKAECQGDRDRCTAEGCPIFETLRTESRDGKRRAKGCMDPVGRGRESKRKGSRRQARAATALGMPRSSLKPGNEEAWGGALRVEIKAGRKATPVLTAYYLAEAQSEAQRPIGDHRPFVAVFEPDDVSYGLVVIRTDRLAETVAALVEQLEMSL